MLAEGLTLSPKELQRLAGKTSLEAAKWAFVQWECRSRGKVKFDRASEMLFVREALEQASHEKIARYHASLFPQNVCVADLTVGIGADLIALAQRGPTVGFELDPERLEYAVHNLQVQGLFSEVRCSDSTQADWDFDYAIADPARRVEARRTLDPTEFSPNPELIANRFSKLKLGLIKLSPLLTDEFLEALGPGLEFLSLGGECREALVLTGLGARGGRFAVHVDTGERLIAGLTFQEVSQPAQYLFDADPAAVRAHCLGAICEKYRLAALGSSNGYLTGNELVISPWLRAYRVHYSGKADVKATKRALRELDATLFEIKQRGVKSDSAQLGRELGGDGTLKVSLVIWPDGPSVRHLIVSAVR